MKSTKVLKYIAATLVCAFFIVMVLCIISVNKVYNAYADTEQIVREEDPELKNEIKNVSPYGLATSLSLSINSGNGKVWATVKNDLTVFSSTVIVIVQLYSSNSYAESYTQMELVCMNSIADLNIGKTITTEAETGGVEKFWLARMRYKVDNGSWSSRQTGACRISASGEFLGFI